MVRIIIVISILVAQALGDTCVTYNFEENYNELFGTDLGVCASALPLWVIGKYDSSNLTGQHESSTKFIYPYQDFSCVSSFMFTMTGGGKVEVITYMENAVDSDSIQVMVMHYENNGVVGQAFSSPSQGSYFKNGWHTMIMTINTVGTFTGYISIMGMASSTSTVLVDSFRYIPPGVDENECVIYSPQTTPESTTQSEIMTEKTAEPTTTEITVEPTTAKITSDEPSSSPNTDSPTTYLPTTDLPNVDTTTTFSDSCVTYNFEENYNELFVTDLGVCASALPLWVIGKYDSSNLTGQHESSTKFIYPHQDFSCVSSFMFTMTGGGKVEVITYMENAVDGDSIQVMVMHHENNGVVGQAFTSPSQGSYFKNGWHTMTMPINTVGTFTGYISIMGMALSTSTVLVDSFRYIPPGVNENECVIYSPQTTPESTTQSEIITEKTAEPTTTEITVEPTTAKITSDEPSSSPNTDSPTTYLPTTDLPNVDTTTTFSDSCVTYNFEENYNELFVTDLGVCASALPLWVIGKYDSSNLTGQHESSTKFIYPHQDFSCVSSFMFTMTGGGKVEVITYMENAVDSDSIQVMVMHYENNGVVGQAFTSPSQGSYFKNGWHTMTMPINTVGTFTGYISIMGMARSTSTVLVDSFRYIPPGVNENECVIYSPQTTPESTTQSEIMTEKTAEPTTTETTVEPTTVKITSDEPSSSPNTDSPTTYLPTTDLPNVDTTTTFSDSCVTYNFEENYNELFVTDLGVCASALPLWVIGKYDSSNLTGQHESSTKFIYPHQDFSCVSSFTFTMTGGGKVEVITYMENAVDSDSIQVMVMHYENNNVVGQAFTSPSQGSYFENGWHTMTMLINTVGTFTGYISIMGMARSTSTVLLDSFRYIPPGINENECVIYLPQTTIESTTQKEIITEKITEASTTEIYVEPTTTDMASGEPSSEPTNADPSSPTTYLPTTVLSSTGFPNTDTTATDSPTTHVPTTDVSSTNATTTADVPSTDATTTDLPNTETITTESITQSEITTEKITEQSTTEIYTESTTTEMVNGEPSSEPTNSDLPSPTTYLPTTDLSTTDLPNTDTTATNSPTTHVPTTDVSSTNATTTADVPSTDATTTVVPSTDTATTNSPNTEITMTESTTQSEITTETINEASTTEIYTEPTTTEMTSGEPSSEPTNSDLHSPTTYLPTTDLPYTHTTATDSPTTHVPTTNVPSTDATTTDLPNTETTTTESITQTEITTEKITEASTTEIYTEPTTTEMVNGEPSSEPTTSDSPSPTTYLPTTDLSTTDLPNTDTTATNSPTTHVPTTDVSSTNATTTADVPSTDATTTVVPSTDAATTNLPNTETTTTEIITQTEITTEKITEASTTEIYAQPTTTEMASGEPSSEPTNSDSPSPTTYLPTTDLSTTDLPNTDTTATNSPTTHVPTTDVSSTNATTTADVPSTDATTTVVPSTETITTESITQSEITTEKLTEASTTEIYAEPTTSEMASDEPSSVPNTDTTTDSPTTYLPTTELPTTGLPNTDTTITDSPTTHLLTTDVPNTDATTTDLPNTETTTTFGDSCVAYNFEENYNELFVTDLGVCASLLPLWVLGKYDSSNVTGQHESSTKFIYPHQDFSCVSSFMFAMTEGGKVEVITYMENAVESDSIQIVVMHHENNDVVGLAFTSPSLGSSFENGWYTLTVPINAVGTFTGYISIMGIARSSSTVLVDSFRYIPPGVNENECVIYVPQTTTESTTQSEITTEKITEASTTEIYVELTTTEMTSDEPSSLPNTDATTDSPTTYLPTTDLPTTGLPNTDTTITDSPTTHLLTTDIPNTDATTTDLPNTETTTTFDDSCVAYNFEENYNELFVTDLGVCVSLLPLWVLGKYDSSNVTGQHESSTKFIYPHQDFSCVSSFMFTMTGGGKVDVITYMENAVESDSIQVVVMHHKNNGVVGQAFTSPSLGSNFENGWYTLTVPINAVGTFTGYISIMGMARSSSTVLVDSFRYIPPSVNENECVIYLPQTTIESITQSEIITEKITEASTTEIYVEPTTTEMPSDEPSSVPNTDATTDSPTTYLPTTDLPTTGLPNTDTIITDSPTTHLLTTDVPNTDVTTKDLPNTETTTTFGDSCVAYNFEDNYNELFVTDLGVCASLLPLWVLGKYDSSNVTGQHESSTKFIYPHQDFSCVSSFMFTMTGGGKVEVITYMENAVESDSIQVMVMHHKNNGVVGQAFTSPSLGSSFENGWYTLTVPINAVGTFTGYISIMGMARSTSTVLVDSFKYIPPGVNENECVIYLQQTTTESTTQSEITTEKVIESSTTEIYVEPTTTEMASEEPSSVLNTDTTTDSPTTYLPTTDLPTTGLPNTDITTAELSTTVLPTADLSTSDLPTSDLPTSDLPITDTSPTDLPTTLPISEEQSDIFWTRIRIIILLSALFIIAILLCSCCYCCRPRSTVVIVKA